MATYSQEQQELSRESLQLALFDLMQHEAFASITVSALAARAGISRMGFYRNYDTKEQVLSDYFDRRVAPFYDALSASVDQGPASISQAYFAYIDRHSTLFEVLIQSGAENVLIDRFTYYVDHFYRDHVKTVPFTGDYAFFWTSFVAAGLYKMTIDWLKTGKRASVATLAAIATKLAG
ncbi:TetR/AcrR family transcriptional regulator [Lacticaseibacillus yichunensis]|uniref:TetR/AcrR family transcriptional regulator n=1 Tax=Lacticaseibacillus yichunensis TaxID=2486015 RepID=A0ABW4CR60_9LACO|nr:TetR/AcrR family transcriptional regulator [Lacticaseibacillus yichunensis]